MHRQPFHTVVMLPKILLQQSRGRLVMYLEHPDRSCLLQQFLRPPEDLNLCALNVYFDHCRSRVALDERIEGNSFGINEVWIRRLGH